jgi:hypothetical protein
MPFAAMQQNPQSALSDVRFILGYVGAFALKSVAISLLR